MKNCHPKEKQNTLFVVNSSVVFNHPPRTNNTKCRKLRRQNHEEQVAKQTQGSNKDTKTANKENTDDLEMQRTARRRRTSANPRSEIEQGRCHGHTPARDFDH